MIGLGDDMDTPRMTYREFQEQERADRANWIGQVRRTLYNSHGLDEHYLNGWRYHRTCCLMADLYGESATPEAAAQIMADEFEQESK